MTGEVEQWTAEELAEAERALAEMGEGAESGLDRVTSYDRSGQQITLREHLRLTLRAYAQGLDYTLIGRETVGDVTVSTRLLPVAYDGRCFETAVWTGDLAGRRAASCQGVEVLGRYGTREAAQAGHDLAVQAVTKGRLPRSR